MEVSSGDLFAAVARSDYESLMMLFGMNAQNSIVSYLAMTSRWNIACSAQNGEEKLDEFIQQIADRDWKLSNNSTSSMSSSSSMSVNSTGSNSTYKSASSFSSKSRSGIASRMQTDEQSYYALLRELAVFLTEQADENEHSYKRKKIEISAEAGRLLRDSAAALSVSRPPPDFVVYPDGSLTLSASSSTLSDSSSHYNHHHYHYQHHSSSQQQPQQRTSTDSPRPPIFDGSVANATPPPIGGPGLSISGGAGTILHLACALDVPLALAFLLAMGADARASHTAFRRLMIHEAACNGSVKCLTLLLELGRKYGDKSESMNDAKASLGHTIGHINPGNENEYAFSFIPRRMDRAEAIAPLQLYARQTSMFGKRQGTPPPRTPEGKDFLTLLRLFRELISQVRAETLSELDAARKLMDHAVLGEVTQFSLARSCNFLSVYPPPRSFLRPHGGNSDGHGNTPLHWAAFKNETDCVSLLLQYKADPNARAHPSGWTPLHDAAYSNSKETIELLLNAGAQVDARANSGATPLCFAAQEDAADAAELLLARGAQLTIRCAGGPVRDDGTVQLASVTPGTGGTAAAAAAAINNSNSNNNNNNNSNSPHSRFSGYTPLHYCAHYNASKAARALLRHPTAKYAMEIPDLSDRLPIHVAVARGSSDVLRELLHAGARVDTRTKEERRRDAAERRRGNSNRRRSSSTTSSATSASTAITAASTASSSSIMRRRQQQQVLSARYSQQQLLEVANAAPSTPRQAPSPERALSPRSPRSQSRSVTPVSSPVLRSMIPSRPVNSSKPWNCLTQRSIDECRQLISEAERSWTPNRHLLFTPADRKAVMELLRVGKRLEQNGTGIFIDLWPQVLSFCGRGWFEKEESDDDDSMSGLSLVADVDDSVVEMNCEPASRSGAGVLVYPVAVTPTATLTPATTSSYSLSLPRF